VYFHGVDKFEYTRELSVFDAYGVSLYHGWVAPPTSAIGASSARSPVSYNHLITELVHAKERRDAKRVEMQEFCARSDDVDRLPETVIAIATEIEAMNVYILEAEKFLGETSSQLTLFGLHSLRDAMNNNQLGVFFRNNHFSTVLKFDNKLYLLVTDEGYINEPGVVWERLDDVLGNNELVDGYFATFVHVGATSSPHSVANQSMNGTICAPPSKTSDSTAIRPTVIRFSGSDPDLSASGGSVNLVSISEHPDASAPPVQEPHGDDPQSYTENFGKLPLMLASTLAPAISASEQVPSSDGTSAVDPSELTSNTPVDTLEVQRSLGTVTQAFDVAAATARMYRKSEVVEERESLVRDEIGETAITDLVSLESDVDGIDFDDSVATLPLAHVNEDAIDEPSTLGAIMMSDIDFALALQLQESMEAESLAAQREQERLGREAAEALLRQEMLVSGTSNPAPDNTSAYADNGSFASGSMGQVPIDQFRDDPAEAERLIRTQEWILKNIQSGSSSSREDDLAYQDADLMRYAAQTNMRVDGGNSERKSRRSDRDRGGCIIS
jgi:hypothetical protein